MERFLEALVDGTAKLYLSPHNESASVPEISDLALESARSRALLTDVAEVFQSIPAEWRRLYEAPIRFTYDSNRFDFCTPVKAMLECPDGTSLGNLHELERGADHDPCPPLRKGMLLAGRRLPRERNGSKSRNHNKKEWTSMPAYHRFKEVYNRFIRDELLPFIGCAAGLGRGVDAVVQASPVLRVVMPSAHVATNLHRDGEYGHIFEELNVWIPLSRSWGSNSLYVETFPDQGDYAPFEGDVGEAFLWWGNQCRHYADANRTDGTRVSFDFRLVPKHFWDAAETAGVVAEMARSRQRVHLGVMKVGSYYKFHAAGR